MEKLIDQKTAEGLKAKFSLEMKNPVDVKIFINEIIDPAFPQQAEINQFAKSIVKEMHDIDPRILPQEFNFNSPVAKELNLTVSPSIVIGYDEGYRIIYSGAPVGHEASSFIETIVFVSRGESGLSPEAAAKIAKIKKPVEVLVFVTPDCPYCPGSVIAANRAAIESKGLVTAICVESMENQKLAGEFGVSAVPQQVINRDKASITTGTLKEKPFILQLLQYGAPDAYAEEAAKAKEEAKLPDKPAGVVHLTDENFKEAAAKYENLVIDFWAEWCGPCKILGPIIEQLAAENAGKVVYGKLNVDENQAIAAEFGIMSIPTIHYYKNGVKAGETVGALPKAQLEEAAKKYFNI